MQQFKHLVAEHLPLWFRMTARKTVFYGNTLTCNMCGSSVREFRTNGINLPVLTDRKVVGGEPRKQDRCPVCHSIDRTRLMRLFLEMVEKIDQKPCRLLHVAPDLGLLLWLQDLKNVDYVGSDLSNHRYRHVPNFVQADLTSLPFEGADFDVIICSHVLEHVPDDHKAMSELYRVLKPGGTLLALTPLATDDKPTDEDVTIEDYQERERRFGQWDHVRLYHRDDFAKRLRQNGFLVDLWDPFEQMPEVAKASRLNPLERLPVCKRPAEQNP